MLPVSYLFVPASQPQRYAKALATRAGAVILDLEDAVAGPDKAAARDALAAAAPSLAEHGARVWLRINARDSVDFAADTQLLRALRPALPQLGVVLPKAEAAADVLALRAACPETSVAALIESARGLEQAGRIAQADGVARLVFGSIDYALDLGGLDPDDAEAMLHARSTLVFVSRLAGLPAPVDGVTTAIDDAPKLSAEAARARRLGFGAKLCIHPRQVDAVEAAFLPTAAELAWARRVVAASQAAGDGAARLDGAMVDRPVVLRAERLLAAAGGQA